LEIQQFPIKIYNLCWLYKRGY